MKKLLLVLFILVLISALVFGGYLYLSLFPKAEPLQHPDAESIETVYVAKNRTAERVELTGQDLTALLEYVYDATPTRRQSVNDSPYVTPYYRITLIAKERTYMYYVYEENKSAYLESPYEGIYRIEDAVIDLLTSCCSK